jgi:hypothetical protein
MRYVSTAVWLIAALALPGCSGGPDAGTTSQMKAAIEPAWNGMNFGLVTGDVRFIQVGGLGGGTPQASKGEDAVNELPLYRAFAANGLITITDERDLTSGFTGWGDWFQLTQSGVRRTAKITLTEKGKQSGEVKKTGNVDELWLRVGTAKIEDIVANDALTIGADRYRVVQGTHTFDIPQDVAAAYAEARGDRLGRERRFKALLKYDPFEKKWMYLGADLGPRTGAFPTVHVDQALAKLRLCGSVSC